MGSLSDAALRGQITDILRDLLGIEKPSDVLLAEVCDVPDVSGSRACLGGA